MHGLKSARKDVGTEDRSLFRSFDPGGPGEEFKEWARPDYVSTGQWVQSHKLLVICFSIDDTTVH